jgi:hypothetical protein
MNDSHSHGVDPMLCVVLASCALLLAAIAWHYWFA